MVINIAREFANIVQKSKEKKRREKEKNYEKLMSIMYAAANEGHTAVQIKPSWFNCYYETVGLYEQTLRNSGFSLYRWNGLYPYWEISWYG